MRHEGSDQTDTWLHSFHPGLPNPLRRATAAACSSMLGMLDSVQKDMNLSETKSESGCLLSKLCDEQVLMTLQACMRSLCLSSVRLYRMVLCIYA